MRSTHGLFLAVLILLPGCCSHAHFVTATTQTSDASLVRTELYFGMSRRGGSDISDDQFAAFLAEVVTPRFPDGLTIVDGLGQWRNSNGVITHERSKVLILLHEGSAANAQSIEAIRTEYKKRFNQESVMRVTTGANVSF